MRFAVLAATPLEILDPDTDAVLAHLDRPKLRVQAGDVLENVAVCSTYEMTLVDDGPGLFMPNILGGKRRVIQTLKASDQSYPQAISEAESYVKVGDRVKQIEPEV